MIPLLFRPSFQAEQNGAEQILYEFRYIGFFECNILILQNNFYNKKSLTNQAYLNILVKDEETHSSRGDLIHGYLSKRREKKPFPWTGNGKGFLFKEKGVRVR
jgi:hypothetical protein